MKLLFVHECIGALGGAEANILATSEALATLGHEIALLHGPSTGRQEDAWRDVFARRFAYSDSDDTVNLATVLAEFAPDLVFLHKLSDLTLAAALADCGVPVVRMVHDHDLTCMRSYKYHPLTRTICTRAASAWCVFPCGASLARQAGPGLPFRWVSYTAKRREIELNRRFACLVVATRYMQQELLRNGFAADRLALHAPVPRPGESAVQGSFGPRNLIVYSGQIIRGKGVDVLLEALALLSTPFEAIIFGDGSHREACMHLSRRLGLADRVTFAGFVTQAEIRRHYREASVAVISSVWPEPFGAVGLEAMRCGLPVVGFDAGGIGEWLIDGVNGYLVPWMDRARYAARLEQLLQDKVLARALGASGRTRADAHFSFSRYIDGLDALFARLVATHLEPAAR